jgi:hypothetical protein
MSGQFQADVEALTAFRDGVNKLVKAISHDKTLIDYIQSMASSNYVPMNGPSTFQSGRLDFGQESVPGFTAATELAGVYNDKYDGFTSNFQAFLDALTVLAEAADTIANNYKSATSADQVGASSVQDAIANAPAPQTTTPQKTQTPTQTQTQNG